MCVCTYSMFFYAHTNFCITHRNFLNFPFSITHIQQTMQIVLCDIHLEGQDRSWPGRFYRPEILAYI